MDTLVTEIMPGPHTLPLWQISEELRTMLIKSVQGKNKTNEAQSWTKDNENHT